MVLPYWYFLIQVVLEKRSVKGRSSSSSSSTCSVCRSVVNLLHICQVVNALEYLHSEMHVIHRDVKPSNILLNLAGDIKLCDYSISGYLVNSLALSMGVGFYPYMAVSPFLLLALSAFEKFYF